MLVREHGCDHTHRFTEQWAIDSSIDWDDLLDVLEANGAFCDCEVVLNLPTDQDLELLDEVADFDSSNPWLIPSKFSCTGSEEFNKQLVCKADFGRNTHALQGEILVPAPIGMMPRKRMRRFVHFFVGCFSGLPSELAVVQDCETITANAFAQKVVNFGIEELRTFGFRESAFVLSGISSLKPGTPVGVDIQDRVGLTGKYKELSIHRVIMR